MNTDKGDVVFLSTPITNALNKSTGYMYTQIATRISIVQEYIKELGFKVFLAIDREKWGKELMEPGECTPKDYKGIIMSQHVVVLLIDYVSEGTLIEIGWASSRDIPITIICEKSMQLSPLVKGLPTIGDHRIYRIEWDSENVEFCKTILKERLGESR